MADPFKLIIEDDEGKRNVVPIDLGEVTVGRLEGNAIRLNERNVSRTHMRLVKENGHVYCEDLDSYNGVFINGERITHRQAVHEGDLIRVGDFHLELRGEGLSRRSEETTQKTLIPDLDSTQPEIRVPDEQTDLNIRMPGPYEETPPPQPIPHHEEAERAEPTAIIRLDHLQNLEAERGRRPSGNLSGQKPRLLCVATQFAGKEFEITKAEVVIGRTSDNDIQVDHRSVSRHHAKIVVSGNTYKIVDLGSANGTLVNGEQYAQLALKSGDLIELGHVKFRFIPPGASYSPTTEELAAIQGKPAPTGVMGIEPLGGRAGGLIDQARGNPLALVAAVSFVLAVLVVGGWLLTSIGDDSERGEDLADVESALARGSPAEKFIAKAEEFAERRQWRKAIRLLELALEADTESERALNLLERYEQEIEFKRRYEAANKAIKSSSWEEAWNYLSSIDRESAYWEDAERLRPQVIGALATERISEIRGQIDNGKYDEAAGLLDELKAINPENVQIPEIEAQLQAAGFEPSAEAEPEGRARARKPSTRPREEPRVAESRVKTPAPKPKPKPKSGAQPAPSAPPASSPAAAQAPASAPASAPAASAASGDPKALYNAGIAALQGGDTKKAIDNFAKCVQIDRTHCLCYRAMGISYARAGNGPKAARYYRLYLKYCPTAQDAEKVKKLLEDYGG